MKKKLNLSLSNGLEAIIFETDENISATLAIIDDANSAGVANCMVAVDLFRGNPGFVNALAVIGYNVIDHVI